MRKHWKLVLVLACVLGVIAAMIRAGVRLNRGKEPQYLGRSLSQWLELRSTSNQRRGSDFEAANQAIRAIGTNAIPFLLTWIGYQPQPWQETARRNLSPTAGGGGLGQSLAGFRDETMASLAVQGFWALGSNAARALPELTDLMKHTTHPPTAQLAASAITGLGAPVFPEMVSALADTNYPYRDQIALYFWGMVHQLGTNACLPPLQAALNDPDPKLRSRAAYALKQIALEIRTNPPPN
jgi:hypothetical protein